MQGFWKAIRQSAGEALVCMYAMAHARPVANTSVANTSVESRQGQRVLVLVGRGIGDAVLCLGALQKLRQRFPRSGGHSVSLLCTRTVAAFLRSIGVEQSVSILACPLPEKGPHCLAQYRQLHRYFAQKSYDIVWDTSRPSALNACVLLAIHAHRRMSVRPAGVRHANPLKRRLIDHVYADALCRPAGEHRLRLHGAVLTALGCDGSGPRLPFMAVRGASQTPVIPEPPVLLSPGAGAAYRRWAPEKFAAVALQIIERWQVPVCLTGSAAEAALFDAMGIASPPPLLHNRMGQTDHRQWMDGIRKSRLVIAADTGMVHMAAAAGTPSICILGGWQYGMFHPYPPDALPPGSPRPVCVYNTATRDCYGCAAASMAKLGRANPACRRELARGNPVLCMQEITVEQVMEQVAVILGKGG